MIGAPWRDSASQYGRVSVLFHWTTAILVILLIALGLLMEQSIGSDSPTPYVTFKRLHIAFGAMLALILIPRIAWRLISGWPQAVPKWRPLQILARLVHVLLLILLLLQAVTGVLARWTAGESGQAARSIAVFDLIEIPSPFNQANPALNRTLEGVHDLLSNFLLVLVLIHVIGALAHFVFKASQRYRRLPTALIA